MFKAKCVTYTGARFRGMQDETDAQVCIVTFTGDEQQVVKYLLDNASYGYDEETHEGMNMQAFIAGLDDASIEQFDGCGGVLKVWHNDVLIYDYYKGDVVEEAAMEAESNESGIEYSLHVDLTKEHVTLEQMLSKQYALKNVFECESNDEDATWVAAKAIHEGRKE